jgi:predicted amidohydrolase YtcJ
MRLAVLFLSVLFLAPAAGAQAPDLVLTRGRIVTPPELARDVPPSALAIRDGIILAVGSDTDITALQGPATVAIDLQGAAVLPGLVDSHAHLYGLGRSLAQIDLVGTGSAAEVVDIVREAASAFPTDAWIEGHGWDQNDWEVQEYPHRRLLDVIVSDRPVLLRRIDGHAAWANGEALRRAGITAATRDPDGGVIVRDGDGEPTGILVDNAVDLALEAIPETGPEEIRRRILLAIDHCLAHGLTGVHEAGITWNTADVYRGMDTRGELGLRVYAMYSDDPATLDRALAAGPQLAADGMLTIRAIKLYGDGALGSRGALLLDDYADQPGHRGLPVTAADHMRDVMQRAAHAGFQVCAHAIGDRANRLILDLYAEVLAEVKPVDHRWRVEHAQILDAGDIPRFADLGVVAAMQPVHCTSDMDWVPSRLGDDRLAGCYAWRSLLAAGARLCFGTDFPVEGVDPLAGIFAAVTRTHADGTPPGGWQPQETLDAATAVELYTAGSAWAGFQEHRLGRVQPGYLADLTVLDADPTVVAPTALLEIGVRLTIVAGKVAYRRP